MVPYGGLGAGAPSAPGLAIPPQSGHPTQASLAYMETAQKRDSPQRTVGPALESVNGFLRWLIPTVEKFPRSQKFLLGDRIQSSALDVLERLIEATYDRDRAASLRAANLGVEKLRHLIRLAFDLRHLDERRYECAARDLDGIGRQIGAWRKAHKVHAPAA